MRWTKVSRICIVLSLLSASAVHAQNSGSIRIGDWILRPHYGEQKDKKQKTKLLERCTAQQTNADKITMIFSLDSHYMWTFELANPSCALTSPSTRDAWYPSGGLRGTPASNCLMIL